MLKYLGILKGSEKNQFRKIKQKIKNELKYIKDFFALTETAEQKL